jgi:hypothetical protein
MIPQFKIQNYLIIVILLFVAIPVFAADISFETNKKEVKVGEEFEVKVILNTLGESINAYEGKLEFSKEVLDLKEIKDSNSIVNFWIEKPKAENSIIKFSGITPGGFQGDNGLLFSIVFKAKSTGLAHFKINEARVLRNDGQGLPAPLNVLPLEIKISLKAPPSSSIIEETKDNEPPETFNPEIGRHPSLFDGKWFLAFATQDKGSGIDHYEVLELRTWNLKFREILKKITKIIPYSRFQIRDSYKLAESPYLLEDQELRSYIFIKAVDKAGNERVMRLEPLNPIRWYEKWEIWVIIIISGLIIAYAVYVSIRKKIYETRR